MNQNKEIRKIEILFKEISNLYGDIGNIEYLEKYAEYINENEDAEFNIQIIYTSLNDEMKFLNPENNINLVYIGSTSEKYIPDIIEKFNKNKEEFLKEIEKGLVFLATGNSLDIFGKYIILDKRYMDKNFITKKDNLNTLDFFKAAEIVENSKKIKIENIDEKYIIKGVGIYDTIAETAMLLRKNGYCLAKFTSENKEIKILGFKSTFTMTYPINEVTYFAQIIRGLGLSSINKNEGIMINNFIATYILGPILLLNPQFIKYLFEKANILIQNQKIYLEEELYSSYEERLKEFENEKYNID